SSTLSHSGPVSLLHLPCFPTRRSSDLLNTRRRESMATNSPLCGVVYNLRSQAWSASRTRVRARPTMPGCAGYTPRHTAASWLPRSEEHTSELQSRFDLVCRLLLEKKKT